MGGRVVKKRTEPTRRMFDQVGKGAITRCTVNRTAGDRKNSRCSKVTEMIEDAEEDRRNVLPQPI